MLTIDVDVDAENSALLISHQPVKTFQCRKPFAGDWEANYIGHFHAVFNECNHFPGYLYRNIIFPLNVQ
jgi:hypothetical protein